MNEGMPSAPVDTVQRVSPKPQPLTRRSLLRGAASFAAAAAWQHSALAAPAAEHALEIAPYKLEVKPGHFIDTVAYNGQVPGPLLRLREGVPTSIEIANKTKNAELVHWHGLAIPSDVDGAMEEGTPMIAPGATTRITFTPSPSGFRWYHTHTFAGHDLKRGMYTGQHGFLMIDAKDDAGLYDAEAFLALHDWRGQLLASDDGSMNPAYDVSTINGKTLGFGEPLRVKQGQRLLLHVLNSSPSEVHWLALAGHTFDVIALDGNAIAKLKNVAMLRLAPAERVCAIVTCNNPGVWVLGEVRKHVQDAGMGIVVEYDGQSGKPQWTQPEKLEWDYGDFAQIAPPVVLSELPPVIEFPLVFSSKFAGHGAMDHWLINGKEYPKTDSPVLKNGSRYRLLFQNRSAEDHPVHLHRHTFELVSLGDGKQVRGVRKDVVLVPANSETAVEFIANNPGNTLFHCHQQNHMDAGFMMLFKYA